MVKSREHIEELKGKTSTYTGIQKYVTIVINEMKIQASLVFDKTSGYLIGFIDLVDPTPFANVDEHTDPIGSHALAFLMRGLVTTSSICFGVDSIYFITSVSIFTKLKKFWFITCRYDNRLYFQSSTYKIQINAGDVYGT